MSADRTQAVDRIDVEYVAHLARLYLSADEVREYQRQLDQVIGYVQQIRSIDVTGVEPTAHAIQVQNVFRHDECVPGLDRECVLANAPSHGDEQFVVPRIVE